MTALKEYDKLECTGLWRSGLTEQRREVAVALGESTIVITDMQNHALAHWALAAIDTIKHEGDKVILRPGTGSDESLEISDQAMLEALTKVKRAIERNRPHPGRLRLIFAVAIVTIFVSIAAFWGPQAVVSYASTVLPEVKRVQLANALVERIGQLAGPYCSSPEGRQSAQQLADRLNTDKILQLLILPGYRTFPIMLPGGTIILFENMVAGSDNPAVTAGYILSAFAAYNQSDQLRTYLEQAGPFTAFSLVASNNLSQTQVNQLAKIALSQPLTPAPQTALLNLFKTAEISSSPFAQIKAGSNVKGLILQDPFPAGSPYPVLVDGAWLGLQAICSDI